jgi:glutamate transport system substrate-binding protein
MSSSMSSSMSLSKRVIGALALAAALPFAATACGGGESGGGGGGGDTIVIGTKFDQPGLGMKNPDGTMSGFDVDVATYVAGELGYAPDKIEWKESPSAQRENLIQNGQVTFIAATYSITDARKEKVAFAGPYLVTGQSLLVRSDSNDITGAASLQNNKILCSVSGSTPAQKIKDEYAGVQLQQYDTYSACIEALKNGAVDAVTTDEVILAGYAAQSPGAFKIVGDTFSEERYGIGLKKDDAELRTKINGALQKMEDSGAWKEAFDKNLGPAGITAPAPPAIEK